MTTRSDEATGAYAAQAAKKAWEVPDLPEDTARRGVKTAGIVGAGTTGGRVTRNDTGGLKT